MTKEEALQEARRRWGKRSDVVYRDERFGDKRYFVRSPRWAHVGRGNSWDAAFANADHPVGTLPDHLEGK
jgi:hypothetical protein